jgi:tRNA(Ile)-lysidine synthase
MEKPGEKLRTLVRQTLTQKALTTSGETIVVAVSGGPDSTALLHALASLRVEYDVRLVAAHLNHGFRGAEAEGDAEYVRALCDGLEIPCYCETIDVPALRLRRHLSAQAAAREVRHAFLRRVAADVGARLIALGHNRDDRIETVLLHILRGSGLDGMAGISAYDPPLLRPLLELSRAEIEAYCALHALSPRQDSSNRKTDYRRNRLRAELLPHLASYYNQCIGDSLLRLSELASADSNLLNALAREALPTVTVAQAGAEWLLEVEALMRLPLALRRRVLRYAIEAVRGDLRDVSMETTESILNALTAGRNIARNLPIGETGAVEVTIELPLVRIRRVAPASERLPWSYKLDVPAELALPQADLVIEARRCLAMNVPWPKGQYGQNRLIYLIQEITLPLEVRSWRFGDRMRPRGLDGTRKLQDLFTDRKIRGEDRLRFPVLVDATGRVLAVIGLQADETALQWPEETGKQTVSSEYLILDWE